MTATDQTSRPSDKAAGSILVDETMNALSELLGRVELSEERVTQIIVAVRAITADATPPQSLDATHDPLSLDDGSLAAADASNGHPLPKEAKVVPKPPKIPSGHYKVTHNDTSFIVPAASEPQLFYLVTKGKMVGVFSSWENVSPLVSRVSGATYRRLHSGASISEAHQMMERVIEDKVVTVIGGAVTPTVSL